MNPVRTDVTATDVAEFQRWFSSKAPGRRAGDATCVLWLLGAMLIGASLDVTFSWLVLVGFALCALALNAGAGRRRQQAKERTVSLLPTQSGTYSLDDSGARIETGDGATHFYPWASLYKVVATPAFIYLMSSAATGWIIPKRCFESSEDADQFLGFATNEVGRTRS